MKNIKSLLSFDKNMKRIIGMEMKGNLFFLLFIPLFALAVGSFIAFTAMSFYADEPMMMGHYDLDLSARAICTFFGLFGNLMGAIAAFVNFRYLYNRRKVDFFEAQPLKRSTRFVSKTVPIILALVITGILYFCIPLFLKLSLPKTAVVAFHMKNCVLMMLITLLSVLADYLLFVLLAVSAGKAWHYILLALFTYTAQSCVADAFFLPSEQIAGLGQVPASLASVFLPDYALTFTPSAYGVGNVPVIIGMLFCTVLFFLLGIRAYNKRENECAAFKVNGKLAVGLITGALAIGTFCFVKKAEQFWLNILIGACVSLVVFVLSGLIFYKKAFQKAFMIEYGVICACMAVLLVLCGTNGLGWSDRLPAVEDIKSVRVATDYYETPSDGTAYTLRNLLGMDAYEDDKRQITLTETDSFEKVLAVHHLANQEHRTYNTNETGNTICFTYQLKNGKTITRPVYYPSNTTTHYYERVLAGKEARAAQIEKYSLEKYTTVVDLNLYNDMVEEEDYKNNPALLCDEEATVREIYQEYLNLSYDEAVQALSGGADNMAVTIYFYRPIYATKEGLREHYLYSGADDAKSITLYLPFSAEKTREIFMKANGIRGFAALKDVNEKTVSQIHISQINEDYSVGGSILSLFESNHTTYTLEMQDIFTPENVFGKYPFNQDIIYTTNDVTDENYTPQAFNTLLKQIKDPAPKTLTEQDHGSFGYAVFFVLKDGRVTPYYYAKTCPEILYYGAMEEDME